MKETKIFLLFFIFLYHSQLYCDPYQELKIHLKRIDNFQGNFVQKIIDNNGKLVEESKGYFFFKKPFYLNFSIFYPDKIRLISNGKDIFLYDYLLKQVTIFKLKKIIKNAASELIQNLYFKNLKIFKISKAKDNFFIESTKYKNDFNYIMLNIDRNSFLNKLIIKKKDGKTVFYYFTNKNNFLINKKIFQFFLPKDFIVDDQRF